MIKTKGGRAMISCDTKRCKSKAEAHSIEPGYAVNLLIDIGWTIDGEKHYCGKCSNG